MLFFFFGVSFRRLGRFLARLGFRLFCVRFVSDGELGGFGGIAAAGDGDDGDGREAIRGHETDIGVGAHRGRCSEKHGVGEVFGRCWAL